MKCVIIHGQDHKGSTCAIAQMLADKLDAESKDFFLPGDFNEFCIGCTACFEKSEKLCPHYEKLKPITQAIDEADLIILASPVYVYHVTGAMKALLDHYGNRWMAHRPQENMFHKQAVALSTAAGAGIKSANKDLTDSLFFWGCAKIYKLGFAVRAASWNEVSTNRKNRIENKITALAKKISKKYGKVKPSIKTRIFFNIMRIIHKGVMNPADTEYWKEKGWLDKKRPW